MKKKGFTLIELIGSLAIIAVIIAIAIPIIIKNNEKAMAEEFVNNIKLINAAIEMVVDDQGLTQGEIQNLDLGKNNKYNGTWRKTTMGIDMCYLNNQELYINGCFNSNDIDYSNESDPIYNKLDNHTYNDDGLILWYDGINNSGYGHDNNLTVWKDLSTNNYDGTLKGGLSSSGFQWEDNCLYNKNTNLSSDINIDIGKIYSDADNSRTYHFVVSHVQNSLATLISDTREIPYSDHDDNYQGIFFYNNFVENRDWTDAKNRIENNFYGEEKISYTLTINTSNMILYKNGELVQSIINKDPINNSYPLRIFGGKYPSQKSKSMKFYNFMVYNRVLSGSEIKQNYEIERSKFGLE